MSETSMLLRLYFNERNQEGLMAIQFILGQMHGIEFTIFAGGRRQRYLGSEVQIALSSPFNLLEGVLGVRSGGRPTQPAAFSEVDLRYRPSLTSKTWNHLGTPTADSFAASDDPETSELYLSLIGFEKPAITLGLEDAAVIELLCCSISVVNALEKTVAMCLNRLCPVLLDMELWGYADVVPFRQLSVQEEWQLARTDVLWADLSITAKTQHQYLFTTRNAKPKVVAPPGGVQEGVLTVCKL